MSRIFWSAIFAAGLACLAGCGDVFDYHGNLVGRTTEDSAVESARRYKRAGKNLSRGKLSPGLESLAVGLYGTANTALIAANDALEWGVGSATTGLKKNLSGVPVLNGVAKEVDYTRRLLFNNLPGGSGWRDAVNFQNNLEHPGYFLIADFEDPENKGPLGIARAATGTMTRLAPVVLW